MCAPEIRPADRTPDCASICTPTAPRMAYVYVLGCGDGRGVRSYVGWTWQPERRLAQHNSGTKAGARSTRGRVWQLLYVERCPDKPSAMRREWYLKRDRAQRSALLSWAYRSAP